MEYADRILTTANRNIVFSVIQVRKRSDVLSLSRSDPIWLQEKSTIAWIVWLIISNIDILRYFSQIGLSRQGFNTERDIDEAFQGPNSNKA